jgi:hypothetical protein
MENLQKNNRILSSYTAPCFSTVRNILDYLLQVLIDEKAHRSSVSFDSVVEITKPHNNVAFLNRGWIYRPLSASSPQFYKPSRTVKAWWLHFLAWVWKNCLANAMVLIIALFYITFMSCSDKNNGNNVFLYQSYSHFYIMDLCQNIDGLKKGKSGYEQDGRRWTRNKSVGIWMQWLQLPSVAPRCCLSLPLQFCPTSRLQVPTITAQLFVIWLITFTFFPVQATS